jgi:hemerythrin
MAKVEWNDRLSVGVDLIDEQHKMLLKRLNDFSEAVDSRQGSGEIVRTLEFLVDYTDFHFGTEERHMGAIQYPGLDHHVVKHNEFKATLKNLGEDFEEEGATTALADSINTLLINWLIKHIEAVDQEFGTFLKEKGVTLEGEA